MAEKAEHHKNIPEIIRIIKGNYEILKPITKNITHIDEYRYYDNLEEFLKLGINPNFFTSTFTDKDGTIWYCVFDCGFCIADNGAMVGLFPDQEEYR